MPNSRSPVFLLLDFHYGLWKTNKASLEGLGYRTLSMCGSGHYLYLEIFRSLFHLLTADYRRGHCLRMNYRWLSSSPKLLRSQSLAEYSRACAESLVSNKRVAAALKKCDYIVCSFPPSLLLLAHELAQRYGKRIFLICGHRFHIHLRTAADVACMKQLLQELADDQANIIAVYGDYEAHYMRYFMPELSFHSLPLTAPHIPLSPPSPPTALPLQFMLHGSPGWGNRHPIFAPLCAHHRASKLRFHHHRQDLKKIVGRRGLLPDVYPMSLAEHFHGVVCSPYSAYAISVCELLELNIPVFAPSPQFLIEVSKQHRAIVEDRAVFDCYCDQQTYNSMEADGNEHISPNSYHPEALKIWLPRMEIYQRKHTIVFDSIHELLDRLEDFSYNEVSAAMLEENRIRRQAAQQQWRMLIDDAWAVASS